MKIKLLPLLLLLTSACTFQVEVLNTPVAAQPSSTAVIPSSGTATPIISREVAATATSAMSPTLRATNTSVSPPVISPPDSVSPIRFGPNGTYADVLDSIMAEKSKTYSVNAMKGQVMSISFHQNDESDWTLITMRIVGADGSVLCASDCEFWRGVLPATETYYVTVTPAADALEFMMRVAINPPGMATQTFLYENKYRNASLTYTDLFAPALFSLAQVSKIQPELVLQFIDTQSYANTNLFEAYLLFGSSTDAQTLSTCTQPASLAGPETVIGDVTINGVSFTKSEGGGVGAGNIYEQTYYRSIHNGTCYEITYFMHYGNIGNYDPGTVKQFDRAALLQKFDQILSTLVLE